MVRHWSQLAKAGKTSKTHNYKEKYVKRIACYLQKNPMALLPDTQNCGLCMHSECRERFPRHQLQRKPLVSDPGMHHGTCVLHGPWCMSGSLNSGGGKNVPGIPGACAQRNCMYVAKAHAVHTSQHIYLQELLHSHCTTILACHQHLQ